MTEKQKQYKQILREFDFKRTKNLHTKTSRTAKIYEEIPQIAELDKMLVNNGLTLVKQMLNTSLDMSTQSFRMDANNLIASKHQLLVNNGYPKNYLDHVYDCPNCKDTGFIDNKHCKCFTQALINLAYQQSNIKKALQTENFSTFSFDLYSDEIYPNLRMSPRQQIKYIHQHAIFYIEDFKKTYKNMMFQGNSGLGKTFLCNCIAKELLDQGHTVLYLTSHQLIKLFEETKFHRDDTPTESIYTLETIGSVDLLIIDDLGAEFRTAFTDTDLFNTINSRHLNQLSTIISTNLELEDLKNYYSERVASRFLGNYVLYKFIGADIRLAKKYSITNIPTR